MTTREELDPREAEYRKELAGRAEAGLLNVLDKHPDRKSWLLSGKQAKEPNVQITHGLQTDPEGQTYIHRQIQALSRSPEQKAAGGSTGLTIGDIRSRSFGKAKPGSDSAGSESRQLFQDTLDAYNGLVRKIQRHFEPSSLGN